MKRPTPSLMTWTVWETPLKALAGPTTASIAQIDFAPISTKQKKNLRILPALLACLLIFASLQEQKPRKSSAVAAETASLSVRPFRKFWPPQRLSSSQFSLHRAVQDIYRNSPESPKKKERIPWRRPFKALENRLGTTSSLAAPGHKL